MEVTHVTDDRREHDAWLEELRAKYDGPPPVPLEAAVERAREELGVEVTARHADYVYYDDSGGAHLIPTTVVEFPDGTSVQFFPRRPPGTPTAGC
jgi:hypothetical protein